MNRVQRGHYPTSVMVSWGVSYEGVSGPYFYDKGIKTSAQVYQDIINYIMFKYYINILYIML